ncbi:MAG: energy transducer TonB [Cyclobacteriaceae bacterium]
MTKRSQEHVEEFYVLKEDKNIRHGTYVKYRDKLMGILGDPIIYENGTYDQGVKVGEWKKYYDFRQIARLNKIRERGTYVNDKKQGLWYYYFLDTLKHKIEYEDVMKENKKKKLESVNISIQQDSVILRQVGMYLNGQRKGEWVSFDREGKVIQRYNFSSRKLLFSSDHLDSTSYNSTRGPVYLGGTASLTNQIFFEFDLNRALLKDPSTDNIRIAVAMKIRSDGSMEEASVEESSGIKSFDKEYLRAVQTLQNDWIPAISNGLPVDGVIRWSYTIVKEKQEAWMQVWSVKYDILW